MAYAQLGEQCIDGTDLDTGPAAGVAQRGCTDVVIAVRLNEWQCGEALHDLGSRLRPGEALQEFLQHETGRDDDLRAEQDLFEMLDLGHGGRDVTPKRE